MTEQRIDIQALRGVAVLLVLVFHANIGIAPSGFLGVDVFFVISGYLITGLLVRQRDADKVDVLGFYFRRARRLLPAAFVVFAVVALLSPVFLSTAAMGELRAQLIGAVTYTINFVLAAQTGYFDVAAEHKPLLHIWSLAIEEQYYLILPLIVIATPRRHLTAVVAAATVASLLICFTRLLGDKFTFFLLPSRAWELGIGSLGALVAADRLRPRLRYLAPVAAAVVVGLPLLLPVGNHPSWGALLICLATLTILLAQSPWLSTGPLVATFAIVGDISYSLYLVHWPLFVFFRQAWMGEQTTFTGIALLLMALVLGFLLYATVERPIRHAGRWPRWAAITGFIAGTVMIPATTFCVPAERKRAPLRGCQSRPQRCM